MGRFAWLFAGALLLLGCYAEARTEPAYVDAVYVPPRVDVYPSYYYDGRVVYLVDGRWYFRHPRGHWVYYRREPEPLYRRRIHIQQAPPAAAERRRLRSAPPATYREQAPPARRRGHPDDRYERRDRDERRDRGDRHRY